MVDPATWLNRLVARTNVQRIAARLPLGAAMARRDGADIFDLVQGFVRSGVLSALIELRVLHRLMDGPLAAADVARASAVPPERMEILLQAGAAMGLLKRRRDGRFRIALGWPELSMGTFMGIASAPGKVEDNMRRVAGSPVE